MKPVSCFLIVIITTMFELYTCLYKEKLRFQKDKPFKILQMTDLHYGELIFWDLKSNQIQEKLIETTKPDLIIITGDAVTGDSFWSFLGFNPFFYQVNWWLFTRPYQKYKIPYAYVLGNHDHQGNYQYDQIAALDKTHDFSLMGTSPDGIPNYHVPIYASRNETEVASLLWMFYTNDFSCEDVILSWGCFNSKEIDWYRKEIESLKSKQNISNMDDFPSGLGFYHIPIPEFMTMYNTVPTTNKKNEGICCPRKNTGWFDIMKNEGKIRANFVGHDHNNYFSGYYKGVELVMGRKTGVGNYGPCCGNKRGGRVIEITEKEVNGKIDFDYSHYMVLEDGSIAHDTEPTQKTDIQETCSLL